jgi:hypothetical protein
LKGSIAILAPPGALNAKWPLAAARAARGRNVLASATACRIRSVTSGVRTPLTDG